MHIELVPALCIEWGCQMGCTNLHVCKSLLRTFGMWISFDNTGAAMKVPMGPSHACYCLEGMRRHLLCAVLTSLESLMYRLRFWILPDPCPATRAYLHTQQTPGSTNYYWYWHDASIVTLLMSPSAYQALGRLSNKLVQHTHRQILESPSGSSTGGLSLSSLSVMHVPVSIALHAFGTLRVQPAGSRHSVTALEAKQTLMVSVVLLHLAA